jgi:DNA adenine methylase
MTALLRVPGSKHRLAGWIEEHLPGHSTYVEPYGGSLAVLLAKRPSASEVVNDLDKHLVGLYRVARDPELSARLADLLSLTPWSRAEWEEAAVPSADPVEQARRTLVRAHQSYGARTGRGTGWRHNGSATSRVSVTGSWARLPEALAAACQRLRHVQIECRPALDLIRAYSAPEVLLYCDPPYLGEVRTRGLYRHEVETPEEHTDLLDALLAHPGPVVLSGYDSPLYSEALRGWTVAKRSSVAQGGASRTEVLWCNRPPRGQGRLL